MADVLQNVFTINGETLDIVENMPAKWQLLIYLGQQTIKNLQQSA